MKKRSIGLKIAIVTLIVATQAQITDAQYKGTTGVQSKPSTSTTLRTADARYKGTTGSQASRETRVGAPVVTVEGGSQGVTEGYGSGGTGEKKGTEKKPGSQDKPCENPVVTGTVGGQEVYGCLD